MRRRSHNAAALMFRPLAAGALLALALTGCAAGAAGNGSTAPSSRARPATSTTIVTSGVAPLKSTPAGFPARRNRKPAGPRLGVAQRVQAGGSTLSVTVSRVIDPLLGSGAALVGGARAVGVLLTIRDQAGATYDSTASGDVSLVTSTGTAAPVYVPTGICQTPVVDFESLLATGTAHSGCVGFQLPRSARILAVRFSPHSRATGSVTWALRPGTQG